MFCLAALLLCPLRASRAQSTPGQEVAAYRANMRRQLGDDAQLQKMIGQADFSQSVTIAIYVGPSGQVVRELMIGFPQDPQTEYGLMDYIATLNFGVFSPDMPDHPLKYMLPISRG